MAQIGTIKVEGPSGPVSIPVYDTADPSNNFVRIETATGAGALALEDPSSASYPYLRVETAQGTLAVTEVATFTAATTYITLDTEQQWADNIVSTTGYVLDGIEQHIDWQTLQQGLDYGSLTRDLVGYWPLDNANEDAVIAEETSRNERDGIVNGASYTSGQVGPQALDFDGTDDDVEMSEGIIPNSQSLTLSAWVNIDDGASQQIIVGESESNNEKADLRVAGTTGNPINFVVRDGTNANVFRAEFSGWNTGTWYHLIGIFDTVTQNIKLYVNGALEDTTSVGVSSLNDNGYPLIFGSRDFSGDANPDFYDGRLDDVHLYNRVLTEPEIDALHDKRTTTTVGFGDTL